MDQQAILDQVVEDIYEGATDPAHWEQAIGNVGRLTGSVCGNMQTRRGNQLLGVVGWNLRPEDFQGEFQHRILESDEWTKRKPAPPFVGAVRGSALISLPDLQKTEFYHEACKPFDMAWLAASMFLNDGTDFGSFSVWRAPHMEDYSGEDLRIFEILTPHLNRAFRFASRLGAAELQRRQTEHALDGLRFGLVLLAQGGRVLYANRKAEAILRAAVGMTVQRGRLRGVGTVNASRLAEALVRCEGKDRARTGGAASILRDGRRPLELWAMPLPRAAPPLSLPEHIASVCVLVIDPEQEAVPPTEALRALHGLTQAEAQLAIGLLRGQRLDDYADHRRITLSTARTQLRSVFAKTDTSRQAELVRLLSSVPFPFED